MIYNIYRPPSGSVAECVKLLSELIESELGINNKEVVCMGDFNVNYKAKRSPDTKKLISWGNKYGLTQLIKTNTRNAKTSRSLIDLIFANMDYCSMSEVLDLHISDHQPVFVVKKKLKDTSRKVAFKGRSYINYNKDLLSDALTHDVKTLFRQDVNPNVGWDHMEKFLVDFLDRQCPIKTFRSKENTPAWITHDVIVLSKDRDRAWKKSENN